MALTDFISDVQLMWDQAGTHTAQTAEFQTELFTLIFTGAETQGKTVHTVNLTGEQTILRFAEGQFAVEQHFAHGNAGFFCVQTGADIGQQTFVFNNFFDLQLPAFVTADGITGVEHHAGDRGIISGIQTVFTGGGEKQGDHAHIQRDYGS
ncbi:hypothetical protein SRABI106_02888 [Rahnella aquatilis]|nr:hypothetical protein SRABI106_02888 [Rahnella aquatilis]